MYRTRAGQSLYRADILSESSRKASLDIIVMQALCLSPYDIILLLMSDDSDLFISITIVFSLSVDIHTNRLSAEAEIPCFLRPGTQDSNVIELGSHSPF